MDVEREDPVAVRRAVLLIDDDSAGAFAITRTLEEHHVEYVVVGRWTGLLEQVVEQDPEVVLLESAMAGAAGLRLIGMVRAAAPSATIVVLSDLEMVDVAALEVGASLVVQPSDLRPMQAMLRHGAVPEAEV